MSEAAGQLISLAPSFNPKTPVLHLSIISFAWSIIIGSMWIVWGYDSMAVLQSK